MGEPRGIALIYVPDGVDPGARFAGRTLLERGVALAESAGLCPFVVGSPAAASPGVSPATSAGPGPRTEAGSRVPWLAPGQRLPLSPPPGLPIVLWRCDLGWIAGALRALLAEPAASRVAARDDASRVALVRLSASRLGGVVPASLELAAAGASPAGPPGEIGPYRLVAFAAGTARPPRTRLQAASGARRVSGLPSTRAAEARLVATLPNPRDGAVDRVFNRHLSRRLTPLLLGLPITPNQVTALALGLGILATAMLAQPGILWPILGALLLQATVVLDCIDGEIARAKVLETEWGEWLDITSDTVIHVLVFLGMAVHAWPELGGDTAWLLGTSFATGGFASFVVVTRAERTEERWKPLDCWQSRLLATLLATLTTRDLSVLVLAAAATGMMTRLLEGAAFGAHGFWIVALLLHRDVMRRAAQPAVAGGESDAAAGGGRADRGGAAAL